MENFQPESKEKTLDLIEEFFRYLRYWHYFIISLIVCFVVSYYYLNHTVPVYQTNTKIKIIDDSKNGFILPTNTGFFGKSKVNLNNEIEVLKSNRLLEQVCKNLILTTQYYTVGYINTLEIWKNRPFSIEWLGSPLIQEKKAMSFTFEIVEGGYKVVNTSDGNSGKVLSFNTVQYIDKTPYRLSLQVGTSAHSLVGNSYLIVHNSMQKAVSTLFNQINIVNSNKDSDILIVSINGVNKDKSEGILNELVKQYELDGINDRRLVSQRTIDFVNARFKFLERELDSIETNKANYKRSNELTFIEADAGVATELKVSAKSDVFQSETQIALSKLLEKAIKTDSKLNLLPTNIGISSTQINQLIENFNAIVLDRDRILISAGDNNPKIKYINGKLVDLQRNILESIKVYQNELEVSLLKNNFKKNSSIEKFSSIPNNEKILRGIERQQNIKETLYLLLLQKREEAAVNIATTTSSVKVIDYALTDLIPVSPKKPIILLFSIFIGLFIPFLIIYIGFLLDDKLHTKDDILKLTRNKIILTEVPHINGENKLTGLNDRSVLGESFRILRTNLTYVFPLQKERIAQTIMITSTIKGEGKTFTALNLSISFSIMDKKVLLIGADMRNPQLHNYLNIKKTQLGLQDYLHDISVDWHNTVNKNYLNNSNLDIIMSGAIPPNPAELLANGRMEKMIAEAKKEYDFIIIDTPPTLLVTDTLVISHLVDTTLYVVRADFTPKKLLEFSVNLSEKGKLRNMAYVINNVGSNYKGYSSYGYSYKYNYGYGYGYDSDLGTKKSFLEKFMSFFKKQNS